MTAITEKITTALQPLAAFEDPIGTLPSIFIWNTCRIRRALQTHQKRPPRFPTEYSYQKDCK